MPSLVIQAAFAARCPPGEVLCGVNPYSHPTTWVHHVSEQGHPYGFIEDDNVVVTFEIGNYNNAKWLDVARESLAWSYAVTATSAKDIPINAEALGIDGPTQTIWYGPSTVAIAIVDTEKDGSTSTVVNMRISATRVEPNSGLCATIGGVGGAIMAGLALITPGLSALGVLGFGLITAGCAE